METEPTLNKGMMAEMLNSSHGNVYEYLKDHDNFLEAGNMGASQIVSGNLQQRVPGV